MDWNNYYSNCLVFLKHFKSELILNLLKAMNFSLFSAVSESCENSLSSQRNFEVNFFENGKVSTISKVGLIPLHASLLQNKKPKLKPPCQRQRQKNRSLRKQVLPLKLMTRKKPLNLLCLKENLL